jgi:four helix bundle protein
MEKHAFKSYRDLAVWQRAMDLAKNIYRATAHFPNEERFGLVNQMRRAAVSIPSNIAEGHARSGAREFQRFVSIALGSVAELETQVILSTDLGYLENQTKEDLLLQLDTVGKMLRGLHKSLAAHY